MPVRHGGRPLHKPKPGHYSEDLFRGNFVLAGNPRGGSLVFSAIGDYAFLAAGHKLENNLFTAVQASPSVIFGGGED